MELTSKHRTPWTDEKPQTNPSADGYVCATPYDPLYRLISKTYPDSTAVNYTYDLLSRLTQVADPTATYTFSYDNIGRLLGTGTQYSFLSGNLTNSYGYDAASNRTSFTDPEGAVSTYSYDTLNRLTGLANTNSGSFGFGYDALGRRTSLTRPNGVNTSYAYDTLSRLLSVLHAGGALPGSTSYVVDAAGNRTSKTAVQQSSPSPVSVTSNYTYDNIYELTQAVVGGTLAESYSYDAVGNRLASAGPTSYNYNTSNELTSTSAATYTYDNNGNTLSKTTSAGTTNYTWDFENRLTQVTLPGTGGTVSLNYDPFGRRIRKSSASGTTIYAYDGDNITQELGASGNVTASYTQGAGIDEPLAQYQGLTTSYYHADGLGSVTSLTDGTGNLAASYVYDSFGNLTASTGTITNPFQYTAREFDSDTSLYYYRNRYYDPTASRFLSEDPIGVRDSVNVYVYVGNQPITGTDPFGLYKLIGFPPDKEQQMKNAIEDVKDKLQGKPCCAGPNGPGLLRLLDDATFVYVKDLKDKKGRPLCGEVNTRDWIHHRVEISDNPFNPNGGGCCNEHPGRALSSVVLHETSHLTVTKAGEPQAYKLEKECFDCGTGKPPEDE